VNIDSRIFVVPPRIERKERIPRTLGTPGSCVASVHASPTSGYSHTTLDRYSIRHARRWELALEIGENVLDSSKRSVRARMETLIFSEALELPRITLCKEITSLVSCFLPSGTDGYFLREICTSCWLDDMQSSISVRKPY